MIVAGSASVALLLTLAGVAVVAAPSEPDAEAKRAQQVVPPGYRQVAEEHGIPPALFYAIALTESGYTMPTAEGIRPWPWTLNIRGEGRYYPSHRAAAAALAATVHSGETAVDVGIMQIHWHFHHAALGGIRRALDPCHNLRVGADILAQCYQQSREWWSAAGCYHAPNNATLSRRYQARVQQHWRTVVQDP